MINCIRYLDITELSKINRMTIYEYQLRIKAFNLKQLDKSKDMHLQAWINQQVKASRKDGKSYFKTFKSFFDFDTEEKKLLNKGKARENIKFINLVRNANK